MAVILTIIFVGLFCGVLSIAWDISNLETPFLQRGKMELLFSLSDDELKKILFYYRWYVKIIMKLSDEEMIQRTGMTHEDVERLRRMRLEALKNLSTEQGKDKE